MSTRELPATLSDLLHSLRKLAADAEAADGAANPGYTQGQREGWKLAVKMAEERNQLTAPDWATPLREYGADLEEQARRTRTLSDATLPPTGRAGKVDALMHARTLADHALQRAKRHQDQQAQQAALRDAVAPADDLSDWSGYPIALADTAMVESFTELALFLGGDATSFTGDLLRLIAKADPTNINKLAQVYPREVRAFVMWRAAAPLHARTLVELLKAAHAMGVRNS